MSTELKQFITILKDFFPQELNMSGQKILDIGPGQCDMLDLFKTAGAQTCGIDKESAVIELGILRGHEMTQVTSFNTPWPYAPASFDGLFCRGSLNYFVTQNSAEETSKLLDNIFTVVKPGGWVWIMPWLRPAESMPMEPIYAIRVAAEQIMKKYGVMAFEPDEAILNCWYRKWGATYYEIWIRNLPYDTSWPLLQP